MKVYYSRVSTQEQNDERQLQNLEGFDAAIVILELTKPYMFSQLYKSIEVVT